MIKKEIAAKPMDEDHLTGILDYSIKITVTILHSFGTWWSSQGYYAKLKGPSVEPFSRSTTFLDSHDMAREEKTWMKCLLLCQMPLTSDSHQIHTAALGPMLRKFLSSHHQSALSLWREATCDTSAPRPVCSPALEVKIPLSCNILNALGQKARNGNHT